MMGEEYITMTEPSPAEETAEALAEEMTEETPEAELSDAEYAELVGEEDIQEESTEEPQEQAPESLMSTTETHNDRKKRHTKKKTAPTASNAHKEETEQEKRKVHAVGGTDTLKTGTAQKTEISPEVREAVSEAMRNTVRAGRTTADIGTGTGENFYKGNNIYRGDIVPPHTPERPTHDNRTEGAVLPDTKQKEQLLHGTERIAKKAAEWKEESYGKSSVRKFTVHRPGTIVRDMERGGRSFSHAVRSFASGQETAEQTGERSLRKYFRTAADAADLLAVLGGKATAQIQKERSRSFVESAVSMEHALESGKLKQSDLLLSKAELKDKIRKSGLKPYESWGIVRHRQAIHDALVTKEALIKLKDESPDQKHVFSRTKVLGKNVIGISAYESRKQVGILTSDAGKFYNDFQYAGWTKNMIRTWFASQPDPMLRKLNPADMSIRELKTLILNAERYHLSSEQISVLRVLLMGKKARKNRAMDRYLTGFGGAFRSLKAVGRKGVALFERVDDVSVEGYRRLATIYHGVRTVKPVVRLAGTAGAAAVRTVGNIPPVAYVRHQAGRQIRHGAKVLSSTIAVQGGKAGNAVRNSFSSLRKNATGRVRTAAAGLKGATRAGAAVQAVGQAGMKTAGTAPLLRTVGTAVKNVGSAAGNVKKSIRRVKRSRPVRIMGFVGRRIRDGAYLVTAPARMLLSGIAHVREGIRKVLTAVMVMIFAVLLIFFLLILFSAFITTIGNSTGEIIGGVVTDDDLAGHIRHLNERNEEKFQEAVTLAKEPPRHDADKVDGQGLYPDEAYHGVHLYHYGSPKTPAASDANIYHNDLPGTPPAGYHFYYIDSQGQTIANHTANTKDIICLTSVMVGNDYDEEVLTAAPELMDVLFDYLNPAPTYTVSPLYHKEGSDRYPYDGYTFAGQTYYCTDAAFYAAFDAAEADHVQFYDRPKPFSEKGCKTDWDAYDAARDAWWEVRPEYPDYPDHGDYEYEDEWQEALDDYYDAVDAYWEARSVWNAARPEVSDYRYCPGHEALSCSYGYRDINIYVTVLTKEDVYRAAASGNVLSYHVPKDYACTEWEERTVSLDIPAGYAGVTAQFVRDGGFSNPKYQEWCDRLYGGDWYSMYGVDTYSDGVSLPTGEGALTQEQIDEMIARIGDVSEAREAIISFALDYVGRIPYYWGGKASVPGFDGNNFGSVVDADYKGRNRKGLDCSGFVGWVYWSVIGVKPSPAMSTSDIVPSLHLTRISFTDLRPGDIGMEDLPGASSNHIGYFVGFDENGRAKWAHCSSGAGGVTVNTTNCFRYYYRLFED